MAQKRTIDFETPRYWPTANPEKISNDGKYVAYTTGTQVTTLIIQSTNFTWNKSFVGVSDVMFSQDSRLAIFRQAGEKLGVVYLGLDSVRYINGLLDNKMFDKENGLWLGYRLKNSPRDLKVINLLSGEEKHYSDVDDYDLFEDSQVILYKTQDSMNVIRSRSVWLNLQNGKLKIIAQSKNISNAIFWLNKSRSTMAFFVVDTVAKHEMITLRYCADGMDTPILLFDPSQLELKKMRLSRARGMFFNNDGSKILFSIEKAADPKYESTDSVSKITIFNYKDNGVNETTPLLQVIDINNPNRIISIQQLGDNDECHLVIGGDNNWFVTEKNTFRNGDHDSEFSRDHVEAYLVSSKDGSRKLIKKGIASYQRMLSPNERYYVWFDGEKKQWFSYNILQSVIKNISSKITVPLDIENEIPGPRTTREIVGWLKGDKGLLIYDRFDIWLIDPSGLKAPVNLTSGYGKRNRVRLRLLIPQHSFSKPISDGDTLVLSAINLNNKENGFYSLILDKKLRLTQLIMAPKVYYYPYSSRLSEGSFAPFLPMKASYCNVYMLECMSPSEFPNICITSDFKKFDLLTHFEPQNEFNWFASELRRYKLPNGHGAEGILYKPESFNPKLKYPIIFYYYENSSDALFHFIHPALSSGRINIPWFVSNGYLVFVPDIHYKDGHPGQCALDYIVSAARYFSMQSYIDSKRMGLQGHSFGGFETNFVVSRTSIFAAAATAAGESELVSTYMQHDGQRYFERGQGRIGATLWRHPELYMENSPILKVESVNTPLLIMHNRADPIVSFNQSEQWFNALSRYGKKVWLLSYEGEGHTIDKDESKLDYSVKLAQFFNYYLKNGPLPQWMSLSTK
jgi:dienelactone hydrolase